MLSMVSRIIITTYLTLIPPKTLVPTSLKYTVVQMAGYGIIAADHFLPSLAALFSTLAYLCLELAEVPSPFPTSFW